MEDPHWNPSNMIYGDTPRRINERQDPQGRNLYTYVPSQAAIRQSGNLYVYGLNNPVMFVDPNGEIAFVAVTAMIVGVAGAVAGGIVAAKTGNNVWVGIGIGAAAGTLIGTGVGAAAGVALAGSITASTAAVAGGASTFAGLVSAGGLGAGGAFIADNIARIFTNGGTVLYSGGKEAFNAASNFVKQSGGTIIDWTPIGQAADAAARANPANFTQIWQQASIQFCQDARGIVHAFVYDPLYRGVESIFWSTEIPTLLNNPNVKEIVMHIFGN